MYYCDGKTEFYHGKSLIFSSRDKPWRRMLVGLHMSQ